MFVTKNCIYLTTKNVALDESVNNVLIYYLDAAALLVSFFFFFKPEMQPTKNLRPNINF